MNNEAKYDRFTFSLNCINTTYIQNVYDIDTTIIDVDENNGSFLTQVHRTFNQNLMTQTKNLKEFS